MGLSLDFAGQLPVSMPRAMMIPLVSPRRRASSNLPPAAAISSGVTGVLDEAVAGAEDHVGGRTV